MAEPRTSKRKKQAPKKSQPKKSQLEGQVAAPVNESEERVETEPAFALASDGHVYMHESELPPDKQRGRKEWRGFRLSNKEAEHFAEELDATMLNVAYAVTKFIREGEPEQESPEGPTDS